MALILVETINLGVSPITPIEKHTSTTFTDSDRLILEVKSQFSRGGWVFQFIEDSGKFIPYNWKRLYSSTNHYPVIDLAPMFRLGFKISYPVFEIKINRYIS